MPLTPPIGTCQAQVSSIITDFPPNNPNSIPLEYFIGATPITGMITLTAADTIVDIQNKITAAIIVAGVTITVTTFGPQNPFPPFLQNLTVLIQKTSVVQITDDAEASVAQGNTFASFTCNLAPSTTTRRSSGFGFRKTICIKRKFNNGIIIPCEQQILWPNQYGRIYELYYSDNEKCCYKLKR